MTDYIFCNENEIISLKISYCCPGKTRRLFKKYFSIRRMLENDTSGSTGAQLRTVNKNKCKIQ